MFYIGYFKKFINDDDALTIDIDWYVRYDQYAFEELFDTNLKNKTDKRDFSRDNRCLTSHQFISDNFIDLEPQVSTETYVAQSDPVKVFEISYDTVKFATKCNNNLSEVFTRNELVYDIYGRSRKDRASLDLSLYYYIKPLNSGGYGCVSIVRNAKKKLQVVKTIPKFCITSKNQAEMIKREKEILEASNFPFIMDIHGSGKDSNHYYLLLEYIKGASFDKVIVELDVLTCEQLTFYMSNIMVLLNYLHDRCIVYRDLKPENLVTDQFGYLKLIDFGTAKILSTYDNNDDEDALERTFTIIGTPHYTAPEIQKEAGYSYSVDYWSFGILAFELLCGYLPFGTDFEDPFMIYESILNEDLVYPEYVCETEEDLKVQEVINELLEKNPECRPKGKTRTLMQHEYFQEVDWDGILTKQIEAPYLPTVEEDEKLQAEPFFKDVKNRIKSDIAEYTREI